jgi:hypothetical protein
MCERREELMMSARNNHKLVEHLSDNFFADEIGSLEKL